jgi:hypothetical protein
LPPPARPGEPPPTLPGEIEVIQSISEVVEAPDPLEALPPADRASVSALRKWLGGTEAPRRLAALEALGRLGERAREAVPDIEQALTDPHAGPRIAAAEALWKVTGRADAAVTALVDVLRRGTATARIEAAFALGRLGPAASGAVASLIEVVEEAEPRKGSDALRMSDDPFEAAYIDTSPASAAADALGDIGPDARSALEALRRASSAKDASLRRAASEAAVRIEAK